MSTTTPSPTYSSITPNYSSSAPIELRAQITSLHNYDNSREDAVKHVLTKLTSALAPYVDYRQEYDPERMQYTNYGSIKVVPLSTAAIVRNNLYTLDTLPFTEAEINAALRHTYPERFI